MVETFSYVVMKKTILCNIALYSYNDERKNHTKQTTSHKNCLML